jgi:hypothetical protein
MSVRLEIERQVNFADGAAFGDTGPYERLVGKAHFAVDPADPALANIVDLDLAPRNADGRVEFAGDLDILKPVDLSKGNRRLFYDMNNRGNRSVLRAFNEGAGSQDPTTAAHAGNGFLMRQGYTVVWSGWQGDLVPGVAGLVAYLPEARQNGEPVRGTVRQEFINERNDVISMPVSGNVNIHCYPVLDPASATLTMREHEQDPRVDVPRGQWQIAKAERSGDNGNVTVTPSNTHLYLKEGFRPGWIYELIYETEGSKVMGLGLFGVRDLISFLRYDAADAAGEPNPLAAAIDKAYSYGSSMSARVVRHFVYEGYNEDTQGRRVFDGIQTQVAGGGRVFVNQRFAQVGRFPRQHEEHEWPSEVYPFAYAPVPDPFSEKVDSVLKRPASDPLVMHTHSSSEYWQRHASLGHTDPASGDDIETPESVRMYYLAGFPHAAGGGGPDFPGQQIANAMSASPYLRAGLTLLDRWTTSGEAPPLSRLPSRADGTLAPPEDVLARFPKLPDVRLPASPSRLPLYNYGPDFDRGLVTQHPPLPVDGADYPVQVPQVDADGNEMPGLRAPDMEVPLGTYTGWNLRKAGHAEGDLYGLNGSFIPFARTRAERLAAGDPRPSVEERYANHEAYIQAVDRAVERLMADGLLLEEDAERYRAAARERNPLDASVPLGPLITSSAGAP